MTGDVLQGLSPSALITGGGGYRAAWHRDATAIGLGETATFGWVDTTQSGLASKLDLALAGTGFYRASPLAWGPETITWDLVATTNQPRAGRTVAQAVATLDACSPYLRVAAFAPRVRAGSDAERQSERDAVTHEVDRRVASESWTAKAGHLFDGLKAFGLSAVAVVVIGAGAYLYLTRKR